MNVPNEESDNPITEVDIVNKESNGTATEVDKGN